MPSGWSKQAYLHGFYCETITFKKSVNMFGYMGNSITIYEGVVETSYKNY